MAETTRIGGTEGAICFPLKPQTTPSVSTVEFHKLLPLNDNFPAPSDERIRIGSANIAAGGLNIFPAIDLIYEQTWNFVELAMGDIDTTISLAPSEKLQFKVKRTQREYLKRTHIDQRESINSLENSIQDRDVVAVTRSSAKKFNWSVNSQAALELGRFDFGAQAAASGQIDHANGSSVESIHDATVKSSQQLTMMSKTEIVTEKETVFEDEITRTLKNPYPNKSVDYHIYGLFKSYDVTTTFDPENARAVLVMEIDSLNFDNTFVRSNLSFLQEHLIEDQLLEEYVSVLRENIDDLALRYETETQKRAQIAMEYLFSVHNMFRFDFPDAPDEFNFQTINQSFVTPTGPDPLHEEWNRTALQQTLVVPEATEIYTTVAFFHRIYRDIHEGSNEIRYEAVPEGLLLPNNVAEFVTESRFIPLESDDDRLNLIVDLAVSLTQALQTQLGKLSSETIQTLCNVTSRSEIWRRLFGCVAFLQGAVVPQVEEDEEKAIASRRFGALETRIKLHLNEYTHHYTNRYLEHLTRKTRNTELLRLLRQQLQQIANGGGFQDNDASLLSLQFDLEAAFVNKNRFVVPAFGETGLDNVLQFFAETLATEEPLEIDLERKQRKECIRLPHDGVHVEAAAGLCELTGIPEPKCCAEGQFSFSCKPEDDS